MNKTKKTELAREYATLKHAAWRDENVPECNNSKKAHYERAMDMFTVDELKSENARLTKKIYLNTLGRAIQLTKD